MRVHRDAEITPDQDLIIMADDFAVGPGVIAAKKLLSRQKLPDAVFAASDSIAAGLLRVLRTAGIRVPDDIAIVAFDNSETANTADPPLTSVNMPMEEMGRIAASRLIDHLESTTEWVPRAVKLPCDLVVRESA